MLKNPTSFHVFFPFQVECVYISDDTDNVAYTLT